MGKDEQSPARTHAHTGKSGSVEAKMAVMCAVMGGDAGGGKGEASA